MNPYLIVDEILRLLTRELVASRAKATASSLAFCYKGFEDPVLDVLWETPASADPVVQVFSAGGLEKTRWKFRELGHDVYFLHI